MKQTPLDFFNELKRRNVFRVAIGYVVSCWLLIQVADLVLENIGAPDWVIQTIMLILALGFPVVLFFSWAYEVTPEGIKRESEIDRSQSITHVTGRKLDRAIIPVLLLALVWFAYDRFADVEDTAPQPAATTVTSLPEPAPGPKEVAAEDSPSIAVLPFVNMSDDAANEYFSDGLSEEILNLLARIEGLKVIARTSSFAFKGQNQDLREVGKALGVNHVVEGSVRKSNDRVRITAQLIKVEDGSHVWSDTYDRTLTDIFEIQDDVASRIVDALHLRVGAVPERGRPTDNLEAYALFLQARTRTGLQSREDALKRALELDPTFAEAYEMLAVTYWALSGLVLPSNDGMRLAHAAAERALALNPDLALARALQRSADWENYSYGREIEAFEQLVREEPANAYGYDILAFDLLEAGYVVEGLAVAQQSYELDPLSLQVKIRMVEASTAAGQVAEARRVLDVIPGSWFIQADLELFAGRYEEAAQLYAELFQTWGGFADTTWVPDAVAQAQDPVLGAEFLDRLIADRLSELPDGERQFAWIYLVNWYAVFGHLDRFIEVILSLDLTSKTWTDADTLLYNGIVERNYTGFTAHPRFIEVARAIGLPELWDQRGPPDFCEKVDDDWVCH